MTERIFIMRGQKVVQDSDVAAIYDPARKRFNKAVTRSLAKFTPILCSH